MAPHLRRRSARHLLKAASGLLQRGFAEEAPQRLNGGSFRDDPLPFSVPVIFSLMTHRPGLILATLLLTFSCCAAREQESMEAITAGAIAGWSRLCAEKLGTLPETWPEYRSTLSMSLDNVLNTTQPTRRYALIRPLQRLLPPLQGELIAVNRSPIYDLVTPQGFLGLYNVIKGPGRYVIYKDDEGEYQYEWVNESYVQAVFAATRTPLPDPDDEPERPWVTQAREDMKQRREVAVGILIVGLLAGAFWFIKWFLAKPAPQQSSQS